jgi:hypothetical protein
LRPAVVRDWFEKGFDFGELHASGTHTRASLSRVLPRTLSHMAAASAHAPSSHACPVVCLQPTQS